VGISREDFNLVIRSIRNTKIHERFHHVKFLMSLELFTIYIMSNQVLVVFNSLFIIHNSSLLITTYTYVSLASNFFNKYQWVLISLSKHEHCLLQPQLPV